MITSTPIPLFLQVCHYLRAIVATKPRYALSTAKNPIDNATTTQPAIRRPLRVRRPAAVLAGAPAAEGGQHILLHLFMSLLSSCSFDRIGPSAAPPPSSSFISSPHLSPPRLLPPSLLPSPPSNVSLNDLSPLSISPIVIFRPGREDREYVEAVEAVLWVVEAIELSLSPLQNGDVGNCDKCLL